MKTTTTPHGEAARRRIRHAQDRADAPRGFRALGWGSTPNAWAETAERRSEEERQRIHDLLHPPDEEQRNGDDGEEEQA
jgi:hypothetical protein